MSAPFRKMKRTASFEFLPATVGDISSIAGTTRFYYNNFNCINGFLAGYRTEIQVDENLKFYYVGHIAGNYCGHINISFGLPDEFKQLSFYNLKTASTLFSSKVINIEHIAVAPQYACKGYGKKMFQALFSLFLDYYIFSSVIVAPYKNNYSLGFHHKCGFIDAAYYENDVIEDIDYHSVYLIKCPKQANVTDRYN